MMLIKARNVSAVIQAELARVEPPGLNASEVVQFTWPHYDYQSRTWQLCNLKAYMYLRCNSCPFSTYAVIEYQCLIELEYSASKMDVPVCPPAIRR